MQSGDLTREEGSRELERLNSARRLLMRAHTRREKLGEVWSRVKVGVMHARRNLDRMVRHVVDDELQLERNRQLRIELEECALNYYLGRMDDADLEVADGAGVLAAECRSTLSFFARGERAGGAGAGERGRQRDRRGRRRHARGAAKHGHAENPGHQGACYRCRGRGAAFGA